jgi:hypothetical protein
VECSRLEREVIKRIKRAKLFVWLREHRHELFDEDLQQELAVAYQQSPRASHRCQRRSWRWRRSCRPTPAPPMMR